MRRGTVWIQEWMELLKELTARGWTGTQISGEIYSRFGMFFSRNAIIGKQSRMGYERQNDCTGRPKTKPRPKGIPKPVRKHRFQNMLKPNGEHKQPTFYPVNRQIEVLNISFADLRPDQCHWVCEGRDEWGPLRCGHPVVFGAKWCPGHARIVYNVENRHGCVGTGSSQGLGSQAYTGNQNPSKTY